MNAQYARYGLRRVRQLPASRRAARHAPYLLRFGLVGGSGVLVNYAILYLLAGLFDLNPVVAAAAATEGAILSNFALNNLWTFRDTQSGRSILQKGLRYNVFALGGLVLSVSVLAALTYLFGLHYLFANLFAIGAATLWNYAANYRWTWSSVSLSRRDPEVDHV